MGRKEIAEIRRQSRTKKRGLRDRRNRDLREARAERKAAGRAGEAKHREEVALIWGLYRREIVREDEYVASAIAADRGLW